MDPQHPATPENPATPRNPDTPENSGTSASSAPDPAAAVPFVAAEHSGDEEDLAGSLAGLAGLSIAQLSLEDLLTEVASYAVQAIPGADGAGLTLLEADRADTKVKSEPFVEQVDDIQYAIGQGPCITATETGQTMRSGSLGGDQRWSRFGSRVGRLGVHSALALPLLVQGVVVGVMNVYAHPKNAFDEKSEHIGRLFAVPAAIAVQNAQTIAHTQRVVANLEKALANRAVIHQAIGILISRSGSTAEDAFDRLRAMSQRSHLKLAAVATGLVDEARRARNRQKGV